MALGKLFLYSFKFKQYFPIDAKKINTRGEELIRIILKDLGLKFQQQKTFEGLRSRSLLRCDFYLFEKNLVIEYNGIHYLEISYKNRRIKKTILEFIKNI